MDIERVVVRGQEYWQCHARYLHHAHPNTEKGHLHSSEWEARLCAGFHENLSEMFAQLTELSHSGGIIDGGNLAGLAEFLDAIDSISGDQPAPARRGRHAR
jgi:hypothetical protein